MEKPSFLEQEPPAGYVPGIGRGATGFSTKEKRKVFNDDGGRRIPKRYREDVSSNQQRQNEIDEDEELSLIHI